MAQYENKRIIVKRGQCPGRTCDISASLFPCPESGDDDRTCWLKGQAGREDCLQAGLGAALCMGLGNSSSEGPVSGSIIIVIKMKELQGQERGWGTTQGWIQPGSAPSSSPCNPGALDPQRTLPLPLSGL